MPPSLAPGPTSLPPRKFLPSSCPRTGAGFPLVLTSMGCKGRKGTQLEDGGDRDGKEETMREERNSQTFSSVSHAHGSRVQRIAAYIWELGSSSVCGTMDTHTSHGNPKHDNLLVPTQDKHANTWKIALLKSFGSKAVERKDYFSASAFYTKALDFDPNDATLFSNRSFCCLRMGDGEEALLDALKCRELRPDWPKACYRQGAALMLQEDYGSACEALLDGLKLDPENVDICGALWEAMESLKTSKGARAR